MMMSAIASICAMALMPVLRTSCPRRASGHAVCLDEIIDLTGASLKSRHFHTEAGMP